MDQHPGRWFPQFARRTKDAEPNELYNELIDTVYVFLHQALNDCTEHLLSHGGHAFAAGCTIRPANIYAFREAFVAAVEKQPWDASGPQEVDAELPIDAIHASLIGEIDRMRPFGAGNPEPVFCACGVRAAGKTRRLGAAEKHLSFYAAGDQQSVRAIAFSQGDSEPLLKAPVDLSFVLRTGQGADAIELQVRKIVASPGVVGPTADAVGAS